MNKFLLFFVIAIASFETSCLQAQHIKQDIKCQIEPQNHSINSKVEVFFPQEIPSGQTISFKLNRHLKITFSDIKIETVATSDTSLLYKTYQIKVGKKNNLSKFTIHYSGTIYEIPDEGAEEYARGFSQTSGNISEKGVYLSGASYWIPTLDDEMYVFNLEITLPASWSVVSQGVMTKEEQKTTYQSDEPQEEVYLIAALFTFYEKQIDDVKLQAFLRTSDQELADKYLSATSKYLKMYESMIGKYPYSKFALVENYWETGYGMPSFTLLGEKVIRFPFILTSSYPHELLHNYWGNSVYVDYGSGNWCEGITAYMADHMLKEQEGQGVEYRRSTLQKYTDFVNPTNDFPLIQFLNRNNAAEEAVGYGKCLMMNHMLRLKTGDANFLNAYRNFYAQNIYKKASFNDIAAAFKTYNQWDVQFFFDQWTTRGGAPDLALNDVARSKVGQNWQLQFNLTQKQPEDVFVVDVPVAIYFADTVIKMNFTMNEKSQGFNYKSLKKPLRIEVDPEYDIFRKLDRREVPPSISQIMGTANLLIVLPSKDTLLEAYKLMATTWEASGKAQGKIVKIEMDNEISQLPIDQSVWVLGKNNTMARQLESIDTLAAQLSETDYKNLKKSYASGSLVITSSPNKGQDVSYGWVVGSSAAAVAGLTRLLPHYGKYSALAFDGNKPTNTAKITLMPKNSPLHFQFEEAKKELPSKIKITPAQPLAR